jgi:hypothetical protein
VGRSRSEPGLAPKLFLLGEAPLLHPEQQVFDAMLDGWRDQQLARNLRADTIKERRAAVRRFQRFTND